MAKSNLTIGATSRVSVLFLLILAMTILLTGSLFGDTYTTHLSFNEHDLTFSQFRGYDLVGLKGTRWINDPGKPHLPLCPVRIALPPGSTVRAIKCEPADSVEIPGTFMILPSQPPQRLSETVREFVPPDENAYTIDRFPTQVAELAGEGHIGGTTICDIFVYPLVYLPQQRKLQLYTEVEIEVEFDSAPTQASLDRDRASMVGSLTERGVFDGECSLRAVGDLGYEMLGEDERRYLIVTDTTLVEAFAPLRWWKFRKGLGAYIVTVQEIDNQYSGGDLQEKIRNCIDDYSTNFGTDWVLLGGDVELVPTRIAYVPLSDRPYIACDQYSSDLDGTWNEDGDLDWGEYPDDGVDLYADVFIGRAPVSNPDEVEIFVQKVLAYEGVTTASAPHATSALFIGEILWGDPSNPEDPDYTDAGLAKDLIDSLYIPEFFDVEKLYQSLGNLNLYSVLDALNSGKGIVNICCHGYYTSISLGEESIILGDFLSLENQPSFGILYSTACLAGGFDCSYSDCMGEGWVLSQEGGGFFIGNSRYGWGAPGCPGEGPSDYYDQSFFESIFITGFSQLGKAHADAKNEFVAESRWDPYMRYVMYGLNLLGDPELSIWTEEPEVFAIQHPRKVRIGSAQFKVTVTSDDSPVEGASVCIYKPGDFYLLGESNAQGKVQFPVEASCPGVIHVTVTMENFFPYLDSAFVVDDIVPPAQPVLVVAEEDSGPSVRICWSPSSDSDVWYYVVYRSTGDDPDSLAGIPAPDTCYSDTTVVPEVIYSYWVCAVDSALNRSELSDSVSIAIEGSVGIEDEDFGPRCLVVTPNPTSGSIEIRLRGHPVNSRIDVFDIEGRWICQVVMRDNGDELVGVWDGHDSQGRLVSPGIYMIRLGSGKQASTRKVILVR